MTNNLESISDDIQIVDKKKRLIAFGECCRGLGETFLYKRTSGDSFAKTFNRLEIGKFVDCDTRNINGDMYVVTESKNLGKIIDYFTKSNYSFILETTFGSLEYSGVDYLLYIDRTKEIRSSENFLIRLGVIEHGQIEYHIDSPESIIKTLELSTIIDEEIEEVKIIGESSNNPSDRLVLNITSLDTIHKLLNHKSKKFEGILMEPASKELQEQGIKNTITFTVDEYI